MFDILADSALDIARGLMDQAWGGKSPEGGLDFPSACVLSKTTDLASDVHLELGVVQHTEALSDLPWLADVTHSDVSGPSDTDSPFRYQAGEMNPPGMFGKAVKAYGQVIALAREYGVDTSAYDKWFRAQWGVDPSADLTMAIPVVRSHGEALWGGIGRKLAPHSAAHTAASKQVKVMWHGRGRKDMGEGKLVAWPRLTAIARLAGGALLVEDRYARSKPRRIDYRIVKRELPDAPKHMGTALSRIPAPDTWEVRTTANGALEFIQGFRSVALALARAGVGGSGALHVAEDLEIPSKAILDYLRENQHITVPRVDFLAMGEAVFDLDEVPPNPSLSIPQGEVLNVYNAFAAIIRPFVARNFQHLPPAHVLRQAILKQQDGPFGGEFEALHVVRRAVANCVPDDFLLRLYRLYTVAHKSKEKGEEVVTMALKAFKAPRSVFETRDWVAVGRRVKNSTPCLTWMAEEIARSIGRHVKEKGMETALAGKLRRILSSEGTGDIAFDEIVRQRRNWWVGEYRRRAKWVPDRKVEYQIKAKLFRHTTIHLEAGGEVTVRQGDPALLTALESVARAYLRKRKGKFAPDPDPPAPGSEALMSYALRLDESLKPPYPFVSGVNSYLRSVAFLQDDVRAVFVYVSDNMDDETLNPGGDLLEDADQVDDEVEPLDFAGEDPVEEQAADPSKEVGEAFDDLGFDLEGDDESDLEADNAAPPRILLADELKEDLPHLSFQDIATAVAQYGEYVLVSEYQEIQNEVHRRYLEAASQGVTVGLADGADIQDTRM